MPIERISIELTRRCNKGCWFCYNGSNRDGDTLWHAQEVVDFVSDCQQAGTLAVSFGGGEPLQHPACYEILHGLKGKLFRSMTTNGLLLKGDCLRDLIAAAPDKVHISIHFPEHPQEVDRVIRQVHALMEHGVRSGVNLLVAKSQLSFAAAAAARLRDAGVGNDRIVYLPMRGNDTPTPAEVAQVAGNKPFQSMTCITACHASPRFCSISWDKRAAWCSYTTERRALSRLDAAGLRQALQGLGLVECTNTAAITLQRKERV